MAQPAKFNEPVQSRTRAGGRWRERLLAMQCALAMAAATCWSANFSPVITFSPASGINISWQNQYTLQTNNSLMAAGWGDYTGTITSSGASNTVSVSPVALSQFFRLRTNGVTNVTNGLIAWYKLDEGTGTTVADSSGNGNDGLFVGQPTWVIGAFGDALSFSGNEQVVATKNIADNLPAFTASAWIKGNWFIQGSNSAASRQCQFLGKVGVGGENSGQGWGIFSDNGADIMGYMQDPHGWFESNRPQLNADGNWHLITCCYDYPATNIQMYLDGVLFTNTVFGLGTDSSGTAIESLSNTNVFIIGGDTTDNTGWDASCSIDDVRIYNRILTAEEVLELFRWQGQP